MAGTGKGGNGLGGLLSGTGGLAPCVIPGAGGIGALAGFAVCDGDRGKLPCGIGFDGLGVLDTWLAGLIAG